MMDGHIQRLRGYETKRELWKSAARDAKAEATSDQTLAMKDI